MKVDFQKKFVVRSFILLWVAHFFLDFFVGVWPIYKTLRGIDVAVAGLILGAGGFVGELSQLFFGYFSDRGYRKIILLCGLVLGSAVLWVTAVNSVFYWFLFVLFLMLGSGSFHPSASGMASSLAKRHQGKGVLFFASGGAFGLAFSQLLFTKVLDIFHGNVFVLYLPFALIFGLLLFHRFPERRVEPEQRSFKSFIRPILKNKRSLSFLYFAQVANQAIFVSLLFLLPDILRKRGCDTWLCMGGGHMSVVLGGALSMLLAGVLCDRYGHRVVLLTAISGAVTMLSIFLFQPALTLMGQVALLLALGAFLNVCNPVILSWGNSLVPESPSTVSALLMGLAWCLGNLGPALAGGLSKFFETNAYKYSLATIALGMVVSFFFVLMVPRAQFSEEPEALPEPLPEPVMDEALPPSIDDLE